MPHKAGKEHPNYKHGLGSSVHRNPLYQKWSGIKRRCLNKNDKSYPRYGGAGVSISKEWLDFKNFYCDMGASYFDGASIDRIDNNIGYSKENCRWVKLSEQGKNKRTVPLYELNGVQMTASDWDRKLGLRVGTVRARIKYYGWNIEDALSTKKIKYIGTTIDQRGKYRVEVKRNGKRYFVGRFKTKKEALKARSNFLKDILCNPNQSSK